MGPMLEIIVVHSTPGKVIKKNGSGMVFFSQTPPPLLVKDGIFLYQKSIQMLMSGCKSNHDQQCTSQVTNQTIKLIHLILFKCSVIVGFMRPVSLTYEVSCHQIRDMHFVKNQSPLGFILLRFNGSVCYENKTHIIHNLNDLMKVMRKRDKCFNFSVCCSLQHHI